MARPFSTYNIKSHNQVLGQLRTDKARRRNEAVLAILRAHPGTLPTDTDALYAIVNTHRGRVPKSVLLKLARQVRNARA